MTQSRKLVFSVRWAVGATIVAAGAIAPLALAPGDANADCGPGQTCAVFENADGEEFEVCGTGFYRDDLSIFEIRDETQATTRTFELVQQ